MTPLDPTFACFACHHDFGPNDANLDAQNNLVCGECYICQPTDCGRGDHIRAGDCPHERRSLATPLFAPGVSRPTLSFPDAAGFHGGVSSARPVPAHAI